MNWKKLGKALLFPPMALMISLIPVAAVLLICAAAFLDTRSSVGIISYVVAAYTLTVWCFKIPKIIGRFKGLQIKNKHLHRWLSDTHLRVRMSLYRSLIWNTTYAIFQLGLGFWHHTFWFYSLAGYYFALAAMRFFLVRHTRKHSPGEKMKEELFKYRTCGWVFLLMNLTLSAMVFFMIYWNRTFIHHEITTIALATYTFGSLAIAIVNVFKYRKYNSPVYSASKAINLAAACVSMITLESTMLTTFGDGTMDLTFRRTMLGVSGGVISTFIIVMAIYMIAQSTKKLKAFKQ